MPTFHLSSPFSAYSATSAVRAGGVVPYGRLTASGSPGRKLFRPVAPADNSRAPPRRRRPRQAKASNVTARRAVAARERSVRAHQWRDRPRAARRAGVPCRQQGEERPGHARRTTFSPQRARRTRRTAGSRGTAYGTGTAFYHRGHGGRRTSGERHDGGRLSRRSPFTSLPPFSVLSVTSVVQSASS